LAPLNALHLFWRRSTLFTSGSLLAPLDVIRRAQNLHHCSGCPFTRPWCDGFKCPSPLDGQGPSQHSRLPLSSAHLSSHLGHAIGCFCSWDYHLPSSRQCLQVFLIVIAMDSHCKFHRFGSHLGCVGLQYGLGFGGLWRML
jgi:hypothetical protein